eukprot:8067707-Karenia_brevis.AAC.1
MEQPDSDPDPLAPLLPLLTISISSLGAWTSTFPLLKFFPLDTFSLALRCGGSGIHAGISSGLKL